MSSKVHKLLPVSAAALEALADAMAADVRLGDLRCVWRRRSAAATSVTSIIPSRRPVLERSTQCIVVTTAGVAVAAFDRAAAAPEDAPGVHMMWYLDALVERDATRAFMTDPADRRALLHKDHVSVRPRALLPLLLVACGAAAALPRSAQGGAAVEEEEAPPRPMVLWFADCLLVGHAGEVLRVSLARVTLAHAPGAGTVALFARRRGPPPPTHSRAAASAKGATTAGDAPREQPPPAAAAARTPAKWFFEGPRVRVAAGTALAPPPGHALMEEGHLHGYLSALKVPVDYPAAQPPSRGEAAATAQNVPLVSWLTRTLLLHLPPNEAARRLRAGGAVSGCACAYCVRAVHPLVREVCALQCSDPERGVRRAGGDPGPEPPGGATTTGVRGAAAVPARYLHVSALDGAGPVVARPPPPPTAPLAALCATVLGGGAGAQPRSHAADSSAARAAPSSSGRRPAATPASSSHHSGAAADTTATAQVPEDVTSLPVAAPRKKRPRAPSAGGARAAAAGNNATARVCPEGPELPLHGPRPQVPFLELVGG